MTTPTIELKPSAHPLSEAERRKILAAPGFGRHFTDHMVTIKWTEGRGWHDGQLVPYGPRTPIRCPGCTEHSACVTAPTSRMVCSTGPAADGSPLIEIGTSPMPGTRSMLN